MNKKISKTLAASLAIAVTLTNNTVLCFAADANTKKEENVYATLSGDGTVNGIYVVNSYDLNDNTNIIDYGNYSSIKNLTSDKEVLVDNDKVTVPANKGKFYYQGNLDSKNMPWNISIKYVLDGNEISADELGGKTGKLQIFISIKENTLVDSTFFDNYLMQVSLTLDTDICENIVADGSTVANIGRTKQLIYNIMPGKEKNIEISVDVTAFSMDPMSFKGIESTFDISGDSLDKTMITDETSKITDAATSLNNGAKAVSDGVNSLSSGSNKIEDALKSLDGNSSSLTKGSTQVLNALNELNIELEKISLDTSSLSKLVTASSEVRNAIDAITLGMGALDEALDYTSVNNIIWENISNETGGQVSKDQKEMLEAAINGEEVLNQIALLPDGELKNAIITYVKAAQGYVAMDNAYEVGLKTYFETVKGSAESQSGSAYLAASLKQLSSSYMELDNAIQALGNLSTLMDKMEILKASINTLAKEYATLDSGITSYANGVGAILSGYGELESGINSLQTGTKQLEEGTSQFKNETSDLDGLVDEKIDSMIESIVGGIFEKVSFVSDKNTNIDSVQFVIVTDSIEKPEIEKVEVKEETPSFWQKLKSLFIK